MGGSLSPAGGLKSDEVVARRPALFQETDLSETRVSGRWPGRNSREEGAEKINTGDH